MIFQKKNCCIIIHFGIPVLQILVNVYKYISKPARFVVSLRSLNQVLQLVKASLCIYSNWGDISIHVFFSFALSIKRLLVCIPFKIIFFCKIYIQDISLFLV